MSRTLARCIEIRAEQAGSLRKLARAMGCDAGYLSHLASDPKRTPSDDLLEALGVERVVAYKLTNRRRKRYAEPMTSANAAAYHGGEDDGL